MKMTVEELAAFADICRKKGIQEFKITDTSIEFKLKDDLPVTRRRRRSNEKEILGDTFPEEAALYWSTQSIEG